MLVLSSSCSSCRRIAEQHGELEAVFRGYPVIVSCPDASRGAAFVKSSGISGSSLQVGLDPGGQWLRNECRLSESPSMVTFERGVIIEAVSFPDLVTLRGILDGQSSVVRDA